MSVTIVNDWKFKEDANIDEAMEAAAELVKNFKKNDTGVQLSLWLKNQNDPLHYWHITVFGNEENLNAARKADYMTAFVEKFYPHMDRDTHNNPLTDVVILNNQNLKDVALQGV